MNELPPHGVLGLTWAEIGSLFTITAAIVAVMVWLIRRAIVDPATQEQNKAVTEALAKSTESSDKLQSAINKLNVSVELLNQRLTSIDDRVTDHGKRIRHLEQQAARHDERLHINEKEYPED